MPRKPNNLQPLQAQTTPESFHKNVDSATSPLSSSNKNGYHSHSNSTVTSPTSSKSSRAKKLHKTFTKIVGSVWNVLPFFKEKNVSKNKQNQQQGIDENNGTRTTIYVSTVTTSGKTPLHEHNSNNCSNNNNSSSSIIIVQHQQQQLKPAIKKDSATQTTPDSVRAIREIPRLPPPRDAATQFHNCNDTLEDRVPIVTQLQLEEKAAHDHHDYQHTTMRLEQDEITHEFEKMLMHRQGAEAAMFAELQQYKLGDQNDSFGANYYSHEDFFEDMQFYFAVSNIPASSRHHTTVM